MKLDNIRIALIVGNIVFIILSVLFIILFATKHDSSSAFLLSCDVPPGNTTDGFRNALKKFLENKYVVGTIAAETANTHGGAVFSLRGSPDRTEVAKYINSQYANSRLTDGSQAMEICYSIDGTTLAPPIPTSKPPTSTVPAASTVHSSSTVNSDRPTIVPVTTITTPTPPVSSKFCQGTLKRDILLLVDTGAALSLADNKTEALATLQKKLAEGIPFESGTRIALINLNNGQSIGDFATDAAGFNNNWEKLAEMPFTGGAGSIDASLAYGTVSQLLRQQNPVEAILVTDHALMPLDPTDDIRLKGVFVTAVLPTKIALPGVDKLTTVTKTFNDWNDMAAQNPFATLFCQYTDSTILASNAQFVAQIAAADDTPKCQKLDIIVVFDTSQSVVEPFVRQYADFAVNFISKYTLSGAVDGDNTRTGIISFNSDTQIRLELGENSLDTFKTTVNGIHYTGGTTNTLAAMKAGRDMFNRHGGSTHGRTMVFLSDGQPYPLNSDTWAEIQSVGTELKSMGVDIFFVGDENGYDDGTIKVLSSITGNPDWVFNHVTDATITLPSDLLKEFPCPARICEMAYYAVEISEILSEENKIQSLQFILEVAQNVYDDKNSTQFQLMIYNDKQYLLPQTGDFSFNSFKAIVSRLIQDYNYRQSFTSGHTRIDTAINALSQEMNIQQRRRPYFQSSVLFAGQANSGVLDPIGDEDEQKVDLKQAARNIANICPLIYALDDSSGNTAVYGDDLWSIVVPKERTVRISSTNLKRDFENTDYYLRVSALECKLPTEALCDLNFIDLGVAFDLTGPLTENITDYVKTVLGQFSTYYTAHVSMFGYGGGKTATILASLSAHQNMNDGFNNLTDWHLGLTTLAPKTTHAKTDAPTTSKFVPTVEVKTTMGATTRAKVGLELAEVEATVPITSGDIDNLFTLIQSQFGCGSYSDDADRILVPNVILFVSDNFGSYNKFWNKFSAESESGWSCSDCPGTPAYVFLSATNDVAPIGLGTTYSINDAEYFDLASSSKAVNNFNAIVNGFCTSPLKSCCTYKVSNTCLRS